jgi:hypothetical protein
MYARSGSCRACAKLRWTTQRGAHRQLGIRRFSTQNINQSPLNTTTSPVLGIITSELDNISPGIGINADQISILRGPSQFYDTLKVRRPRSF